MDLVLDYLSCCVAVVDVLRDLLEDLWDVFLGLSAQSVSEFQRLRPCFSTCDLPISSPKGFPWISFHRWGYTTLDRRMQLRSFNGGN